MPAPLPIVHANLDTLVLARLATTSRPGPHAALVQALRGFTPPHLDAAAWSTALFEAVTRLRAAGELDDQRRATAPGRSLQARLGLTSPPSWPRVTDHVLPGLALGVDATDDRAHARLRGRDAWAAAILGRAFGTWHRGAPPGLSAACDALVWRALALPPPVQRTPPTIRTHFLAQLLAGGGGGATIERQAALLAAREVGAVRTDARALREALVRRWLVGQRWGDFAAQVAAAAARATDGRFGPRKVFISAVWRDPTFSAMTLDEFKRALLAAHQAGTVRLARADLTGAFAPELLRDSELAHLETRYHFIERTEAS